MELSAVCSAITYVPGIMPAGANVTGTLLGFSSATIMPAGPLLCPFCGNPDNGYVPGWMCCPESRAAHTKSLNDQAIERLQSCGYTVISPEERR